MLRELNSAEKELSLARYCELPAQKAAEKVAPMDPAKAILPDDLNIILDPAKVPAESGYCMLEDGASYITLKHTLPGVTKEMLQWMVAWHGLEPINHVAINGETHHSSGVSDIDEDKIKRPYLSVEQKSQGIIVYTVDKIGAELYDNIIYYYSPADQSLDADLYANSGALTLGGTVIRMPHDETDPLKKSLNILIFVVRDVEGGVEVQTHLWGGYKILRREVKRFDHDGAQPTEEHTAALAEFLNNEWTQIGHVLPSLYEEFSKTL